MKVGKEKRIKYLLVKDDASITSVAESDFKDPTKAWMWQGRKRILFSYIVTGDDECHEKLPNQIHNGYFDSHMSKKYCANINNKKFTRKDLKEK